MAEDVKKLSQLPDGKLSLDVLAGTAHHDLVGAVELWIASELQAWFLERLAISNIPAEYINVAKVDVQLKSQHRHTPRYRRMKRPIMECYRNSMLGTYAREIELTRSIV